MGKVEKIIAIIFGIATGIWEGVFVRYYTDLNSVFSDPLNAELLKRGEIAEKSRLFFWPYNETTSGPFNPNVSRPLEGAEYFVRDAMAHPLTAAIIFALPFILWVVWGVYAYKKSKDAEQAKK